MSKLSQLINRLLDNAAMFSLLKDRRRVEREVARGDLKPGEAIAELKPEERELLRQVSAEDFNHRIDEAVKFQGPTSPRRGRLGRYLDEQRRSHEAASAKKFPQSRR